MVYLQDGLVVLEDVLSLILSISLVLNFYCASFPSFSQLSESIGILVCPTICIFDLLFKSCEVIKFFWTKQKSTDFDFSQRHLL